MPRAQRATLDAVEGELDRIGLLLQHDAELPSVTALLAGAPIAGSWWGHPLGNELYALLTEFEQGAGALALKLVNGKVTYLAERLWPAALALVTAGETKRVAALSDSAKALRKRVLATGDARGDALAATGLASAREFTSAAKELELAFLVHADSVHGASGAHTKVLKAWPAWAAAHGLGTSGISAAAAREELGRAVARLSEGAKRTPKVALLDGAAAALRRR